MNIIEIAEDVVAQYKEKQAEMGNSFYVGATYIPILDDGSIRVSTSKTCLVDKKECLIILCRNTLAINNYYDWYELKHIDTEGCVHDGYEKDGCSIRIGKGGRYSIDDVDIFKFSSRVSIRKYNKSWDVLFPEAWKLFKEVSRCQTQREVQFLERITDDEEEVTKLKGKSIEAALLEKERDQYKGLLDQIQQMIMQSKDQNT